MKKERNISKCVVTMQEIECYVLPKVDLLKWFFTLNMNIIYNITYLFETGS